MTNDGLILYRLDEIKAQLNKLDEGQTENRRSIGNLREAVAGLKVKAGLWGAVAGFLPGLGAVLLWLLKR